MKSLVLNFYKGEPLGHHYVGVYNCHSGPNLLSVMNLHWNSILYQLLCGEPGWDSKMTHRECGND